MWSFFADPIATVLIAGALMGLDPIAASATVPMAPGQLEGAADGPAVEALLESGTLEAMEAARDRGRASAAAACRVLLAPGGAPHSGMPDSTACRRIRAVTASYAGALRQESLRLHHGGTHDGSFESLWTEMTRAHLAILAHWPRLWSEDAVAGDPSSFVPRQLLLLCSPEAYEGETFELPRVALFARMATLPDSLARCCIDPDLCASRAVAPCPEQIAADIARLADLDALVGFRNGHRYWALPAGAPPRSHANDAAVARAQTQVALEMLQACEDVAANHGAAGSPVSPSVALTNLHEGAKLWPSDADPFRTVPGLRNPRRDRGGRLVCDLAISEECLAAMSPTARARLAGRLASGARILQIPSDDRER